MNQSQERCWLKQFFFPWWFIGENRKFQLVVGLFCPEKNRKVCRPTVKTGGTTQNKTKSLALFVIEGAILLSASKIFAWDYVKHGRKDTTSKVQLCIKDHLSSTKCLEFPEQIFQNCLDHKVFDIMRSTRGWNDKLLAAVSHQSNDIKTKTKR